MRRQNCRDIRNPHQAFPEVLRAVNAHENELIFQAEGWHFSAIEKKAPTSGKKIVDSHGLGVIAKRVFGVQLDDTLRPWTPEKILAGYFAGANDRLRNFRMESTFHHTIAGALNVAMAHEQIQIDIAAYGRIAVGHLGKHRAFHQYGVDVGIGKTLQDAKEISRQA